MGSMILHGLVLLACIVGATDSSGFESNGPFDDFGDVNCESEMARLDNFAVQLQNEPKSRGVIMFYAGKSARGQWPKRGEAEARIARIKPYLVDRRGVPADQVIVINAGYDTHFHVQLWIVPAGASLPTRDSPAPKEIRFRKGKPNPRDFRCHV